MSDANKYQVGGTHYSVVNAPQHWDMVRILGWDYFIGNATKYLWRMGKKYPSLQGQLDDLDKAMHYLQKKRELLMADIEEESRRSEADRNAIKMGVLGIKKPLTIGDILNQMDAEEEAACGPTAHGYVDQDRNSHTKKG